MPTTITEAIARDIRFPTSRELDGSDAMNPDPDYSAAYVVVRTDAGSASYPGRTLVAGSLAAARAACGGAAIAR